MVRVRGWRMHHAYESPSKTEVQTSLHLSVFQIMVMPGECTTITLTLIQPLALEKFQQFALKDRSKIICTGVITDILPSTDQ